MGNQKYEAVIGLEVHVQLATTSKMFCRCDNRAEDAPPNTLVCPVCLGLPGALPVPNRTAVEWALKAALALGCAIADESKFDRKQYFYPDLPKGYQISQYDQPFGGPGKFEFDLAAADGTVTPKTVGITRLHLEEDAGKLTHPSGTDYSLVDLNRAGTPLVEIVTEPDLRSPAEAKTFMQELRLLMRTLEVSDADMEKGHLRADANISVRKAGTKKFGTKTELKNLNSFRFVEKGLESEFTRQVELLKAGKEVVQETRGFDEATGKTVSQRGKEEAHDYRYFPEPDIPPLVTKELDLSRLRKELPESPAKKKRRFVREYGLTYDQVSILLDPIEDAEYFEESVKTAMRGSKAITDKKKAGKEVAKIALGIGKRIMTKRAMKSLSELDGRRRYAPASGVGAKYIGSGEYSHAALNPVLEEIWGGNLDPDVVFVERKPDLLVAEDLNEIVDQAIADNPKPVADYRSGNANAAQALVGAVMKATKGSADPTKVSELVRKKLDES